LSEQYRPNEVHLHDFPVFNGKFSTNCFVDETARAIDSMTEKMDVTFGDYLTRVKAVFAHRPYQRMPETSLGLAYLMYLATAESKSERFEELASSAQLDPETIRNEVANQEALSCFENEDAVHANPYPNLMQLLRAFRDTSEHQDLVCGKVRLGAEPIKEFGNLYSAALPAWIGAGLEDALEQDLDLVHQPILALGYGSGDAADALPMRVAANWKQAAAKLNVKKALLGSVDLTQEQYHSLHAGLPTALDYEPHREFVIHHVGDGTSPKIDDTGIDFYQFKND
jgi:hydroxymethylglutaryl-CoA synthase